MKTIFLIEDHQSVRATLRELFRRQTDIMVCGEAGDAEQALSMLETIRPDLILIDVSLPRTDGLVLLSQIKARWPMQKCMMLSGHSASVYAEQALKAGALDYILKDDAYKLIESVKRAVQAEPVE